jgi:hypothetical protein
MLPSEQVEEEWATLLARSDLSTPVRTLIRQAFARPRLRRLFPFMSLKRTLRFSRTTREPYYWDYPFAMFGDGGDYEARGADVSILAKGTLSDVLDAVVAALPKVEDPITDEDPRP